jgi:hypothetical protein
MKAWNIFADSERQESGQVSFGREVSSLKQQVIRYCGAYGLKFALTNLFRQTTECIHGVIWNGWWTAAATPRA